MTRSVKYKNKTILNHISKLITSASYRYQCNSAIITGKILIYELSNLFPIKTLLANQEINLKSDKLLILPNLALKKISKLQSLQGPIAEIPLPSFQELSDKNKIAILDEVTDPGNMGTIIRSALAFGLDGVHITKGSCDPYNDKVIRSSKGAVFKLPISYEPFSPLKYENYQLLLADTGGGCCYNYSFPKKPTAILLSNETKGLKPCWEGKKISINISKKIDSLNVAQAASILFYEFSKQI